MHAYKVTVIALEILFMVTETGIFPFDQIRGRYKIKALKVLTYSVFMLLCTYIIEDHYKIRFWQL